MSRTTLEFTPEGLKRRLADMERQLADIQRRGDWRFDGREFEPEGGSAATQNAASVLALVASGASIPDGGGYLAYTATAANYRFDAVSGGATTITWPFTAVGQVQVEWAWTAYDGGGTIELEIDGVVPAWGTLIDGTTGQTAMNRRSGLIIEGATVRLKITQTSGSAQTADVYVEFAVPDPAAEESDGLDSFWVDSRDGTNSTSAITLESGVVYDVTVTGNYRDHTDTYTFGSPDDIMFVSPGQSADVAGYDAETQYALQTAGTYPNHYTADGLQFDLGSGFTHVEPVGGPYSSPQPGHVYTYQITGSGGPLIARIQDTSNSFSNNNGMLRVDIARTV